MRDFFISYRSTDEDWAKWIDRQLTEAGYKVKAQAWDFKVGDNFMVHMQEGLTQYRRTLALLSPNYFDGSPYVLAEWTTAYAANLAGDKQLLPVRVAEFDPDQAGLLRNIIYIDLVGREPDQARDELLTKLAAKDQGSLRPDNEPPFPGTGAGPATADEPRFPGAATPAIIENLPPRNIHFSGRTSQLEGLGSTSDGNWRTVITQAIAGLGGVGKTSLALEYCHRFQGDYQLIWWVRAEEETTRHNDLARLAAALGLPQAAEQDMRLVLAAVVQWLKDNSGWLLVLDNAPNKDAVRGLVPANGLGQVLITSRSRNWGGVAQVRKLEVWPEDEAVAFLLKRSGSEDQEAARELAEELGCFPLALEQAAAYMEESGKDFGGYLKLFREKRERLLQKGAPHQDRYQFTVMTTWLSSFEAVEEKNKAAAQLLKICAFLAPDDVPLFLFKEGAEHLPEELAQAAEDDMEMDTAISVLRGYSLVTRSGKSSEGQEGDFISIHRLVQVVMRDGMEEEEKKKWAAAAVKVVSKSLPPSATDVRHWPKMALLLPHALQSARLAQSVSVALKQASRVVNQAALYFLARAEFGQAREMFESNVELMEQAYGKRSQEAASSINNLGAVLHDMGELEEARKLYQRALKIGEETLGSEHPNVAIRLNNLGAVLHDMGELEEARENYQRALKINKEALGPEHPNVAAGLNNLGSVLRDMGELDEARKNFQRALEIGEAASGQNHPNVATRLNNLGTVLRDMKKWEESLEYAQRALAIWGKTLPSDHPHIATSHHNLAATLRKLDRNDEAAEHEAKSDAILKARKKAGKG